MKRFNFVPLLFSCFVLASCGGSDNSADKPLIKQVEREPIELGTDIKEIVAAPTESNDKSDIQNIEWDDLIPPDFRPEKIMAKYQAQIQAAAEGSEEERLLFDKVMGEFNSAGPNPQFDGQTVRIPGFVAPLDTADGNVLDFLLVPYYGSCIHSPPPSVNQTVMVNPQEGKSITLDQTYRPVWVVGELAVGELETDLAMAGYQIKNATVMPYTDTSN